MSRQSSMDTRKVLSSLSLITQALNSSIKLDQVLKLITLEAVSLMDADICSIMLLDESRENLVFCEAFGLTRDEIESISFKMGEGVAGHVAHSGRPMLVADVAAEPRFVSKDVQTSRIRSLLCVPLIVKGSVIGVINLTNRERVAAFDDDDKELAILLANHIAANLERFRLYELAITDPLTAAHNYRYFQHSLDKEMMRVLRYGGGLSLLMLDLDRFKPLNDTWGHPVGDQVLRKVVEVMRRTIRNVDILCRYGGEEFAIILPNTDKEGALDIASRVVEAVRATGISVGTPQGTQQIKVTVSAGVATLGEQDRSKESLVHRADQALYRAKQAGRDRVHFQD